MEFESCVVSSARLGCNCVGDAYSYLVLVYCCMSFCFNVGILVASCCPSFLYKVFECFFVAYPLFELSHILYMTQAKTLAFVARVHRHMLWYICRLCRHENQVACYIINCVLPLSRLLETLLHPQSSLRRANLIVLQLMLSVMNQFHTTSLGLKTSRRYVTNLSLRSANPM